MPSPLLEALNKSELPPLTAVLVPATLGNAPPFCACNALPPAAKSDSVVAPLPLVSIIVGFCLESRRSSG